MTDVKNKVTTPGSSGVVLLAFGKQGYYMAAANLALTINLLSPDVEILCLTDSAATLNKIVTFRAKYFTRIVEVEISKNDPALNKLNLYNFIEQHGFDHNIFVDVDSICFRDIAPLMHRLISGKDEYLTNVHAVYKYEDGPAFPSMIWGTADVIWPHFNLADDAVLPATNSSFQYIRKGPVCKELFSLALKEYENKAPLRAKELWGGTHPDELYLNIALAKLKMVPRIPDAMICPVKGMRIEEISVLKTLFYFITFFGDRHKTPSKYVAWYDAHMFNQYKKIGTGHHFKIHDIFQSKHVQ
jgi:hypothetical protein